MTHPFRLAAALAAFALAACGGSSSEPPCTPLTCASQGIACGPAGDGCGGDLTCGGCDAPQTCGGAGVAGQCGVPAACTNLCLKRVTCAAGLSTTVTGRAYAPNGVDPLASALVYVPNGAVLPLPAGLTCAAPVTGAPLAAAVTAVDGTFTLQDVPAGTSIPLALQKGRWRRSFTLPTVTACADTAVADGVLRLPRNKSEGDLPRVAAVTGAADTLECVLRRVGVDDTEYTAPGGTGRIHVYPAATNGGAKVSGTATDATLWASQDTVNGYDALLLGCQGTEVARSAADLAKFTAYANAGGRVLAEDMAYTWLYDNPPFSTVVGWNVQQAQPPSPSTVDVFQGSPDGAALASWLTLVGASATTGKIQLVSLRHNFDSISSNAALWLSLPAASSGAPVSFSARTPVGAAPADWCGEVLFQDFHTMSASVAAGTVFPAECSAGGVTAQEKLGIHQILELTGATEAPVLVATCTPRTCAELGSTCGTVGDGCGGSVSCGPCPAGQVCGGGATRTCVP